MDVVVVHEPFEVVQIVPPLKEEGLSNEAEPGGDLQFMALGFLQHLLQLLFANVTVALDLVGIRVQIHVL